jgi:hypothetical protein
MDFKKSFRKLMEPKVWLHYAVGSAIILIIFSYLMKIGLILEKSSFVTYFIYFFAVYVISDRFVHGLLELD